MDGVQADFDRAWCEREGVKLRHDIPDHEAAIMRLANSSDATVYEFFRDLEPLSDGTAIVLWLDNNNIPWTILSAPLRIRGEASIAGKIHWLNQYRPGKSGTAIFTSKKYQHALDGGQACVLVDDNPRYLVPWARAGGLAVPHTDGDLNSTLTQLKRIYQPWLNK
jgi:hypothetical protein